MAVTLDESEAVPTAYPTFPGTLSAGALAIDAASQWKRIEYHTGFRWTPRTVVWRVEGPDDWLPILQPATITTTEIWTGTAWSAVTLSPSFKGGLTLPGDGPYRITATVGSGVTPPAAAFEAFRRLVEYMAGMAMNLGATSIDWNIGGELSWSQRRAADAMGRALELSGAADLLRPYRRIARCDC
jgi:hypothetical protein